MRQKNYELRFHPEVLKRDLEDLSPPFKNALTKFLKEKFIKRPFFYGKPIRGESLNYWKIRLSNYLIGFKIIDNQIIILGVVSFHQLFEQKHERFS
ncbi:hypothetical protein Thein_1665 [Thermodesulfatator indicus DSM 15286]|uniref:Type II toxin-antitoxin system RelE/ParE family toxin n=1 Tax=Thermodesulfatator indicus (strain DSM 15286 / JCM 11887 / CIR29812) TaxID=667014 RepID=F8AB68_THEID|nr:hypothetical protein [Thermodesulfatator indicus]AEH45524.1 hypothetical protein Thein_1665 [Thermodesulfatator indicus DSM 15286]